jgi:5S rRNA maturation endonuclease (ribonuclease M5)
MAEYSFYKVRKYEFGNYARHINQDVPYLFSLRDLSIIDDVAIFRSKVEFLKIAFDIKGYSQQFMEEKYYEYIFDYYQYEYDDKFQSEKELKKYLLKIYPFGEWVSGVKKYFNHMLDFNFEEHDVEKQMDLVVKHLNKISPSNLIEKDILNTLVEFETRGFYGMYYESENFDSLLPLKVILETLPENEDFIYDFSAPYNWSIENDDIKNIFEGVKKILIVVEGKQDKFSLESFFQMIFPQFQHLYNIVSCDGNIPGGSSQTRHYFNLLTNACVSNRVIALFDNDTAGQKEIKQLSTSKYQNKYKYISLPNDSFFNNYPTIFPNDDIVNMDINKKACSIELYYPTSLLKSKGSYSPIIWKGYDMSIKTHQGVIKDKKKINDKFSEYIKGEVLDDCNLWLSKKVLEHIFKVWA